MTTTPPPFDLTRLRALDEKRTPGPWQIDGTTIIDGVKYHAGVFGWLPIDDDPTPEDELFRAHHANAAFIVALENAYPGMVAEIEQLTVSLASVTASRDAATKIIERFRTALATARRDALESHPIDRLLLGATISKCKGDVTIAFETGEEASRLMDLLFGDRRSLTAKEAASDGKEDVSIETSVSRETTPCASENCDQSEGVTLAQFDALVERVLDAEVDYENADTFKRQAAATEKREARNAINAFVLALIEGGK